MFSDGNTIKNVLDFKLPDYLETYVNEKDSEQKHGDSVGNAEGF